MNAPYIKVNLDLIRHNAGVILTAATQAGVDICAVTKVVCADPAIVSVLSGLGFCALADSRVINLRTLPATLPRLSLRIGDPEEAEELVQSCEQSLQSTREAILALGEAARRLNKRHQVILMVDLGDLREGVLYKEEERLLDLAALTLSQANLDLVGLGTNLTCFGGILPDEHNLGQLLRLAKGIRERFSIPLPLVSGGNSSSLHLLFADKLPAGINHLRVGEGLLLGMDTSTGLPFPQLSQQAFTLYARLVEVYKKPSKPEGSTGPNAFGEEVSFSDHGPMKRGILAIGRQDIDLDGVTPRDDRVKVIGGSSDHLLVDLSQVPDARVGDLLAFSVGYGSLLKAFTSRYVGVCTTEG